MSRNRSLLTATRVTSKTRVGLTSGRASQTFGWKKEAARERIEENRSALEDLQYHLYADGGKALLIVLQGIDTSGKDGVIRNVFTAFNPQGTTVTSFRAPTSREVAHDYLWRVHTVCPQLGSIAIFNRSHYEDLIVPMVQKRLPNMRIQQRMRHIQDFERLLHEEGTTVIKFLLHISRDEQWERLMSRLDEPQRNWKFSMGDLAERERWSLYTSAFTRIVSATTTSSAPWYVVPANKKWFRDLVVSEITRATLEGMGLRWPKPSLDVERARRALERLR